MAITEGGANGAGVIEAEEGEAEAEEEAEKARGGLERIQAYGSPNGSHPRVPKFYGRVEALFLALACTEADQTDYPGCAATLARKGL